MDPNHPGCIAWFDLAEYNFLSNFHPSPIRLKLSLSAFDDTAERFEADTVEHAFQALKSADEGGFWKVLRSGTPGHAKMRGRECYLRPDWETVKIDIMRHCLKAKFRQNEDLRELLAGTGDLYLLEGNSWHDQTWGSCICGTHVRTPGRNLLGRLLMDVREELRLA